MADEKETVLKNGLSNRQTFVIALITAVLASASGPYILSSFGINPYRPDPFTKTDGGILEKRIEILEQHVAHHPDRTKQFDARIITLEVKLQVIIDNQQRILSRLDRIE